MNLAVAGSRQMGRPKARDVDMVSIKIEKDVYAAARRAAAFSDESIVAYVSRVVRERTETDLAEAGRSLVGDAPAAPRKKAKKGGEE